MTERRDLSVERPHLLAAAVLVAAAWAAPWVIEAAGRTAFGVAVFDAPWLVLRFADLAAVLSLLAALILAWRYDWRARRASPRLGLAAAILAAAAFAVAQVAKTATGLSSDVLMLGLLPTLDAQSYYDGAIRLLWSGQLSEWTTRRPLSTVQLAGWLWLTGDDFRLTLLALGAGCAVAALVIAVAVTRRFGLAAACAAMAALLPFVYPTLGTTMSENFGFTVGSLGFVALWLAAGRRCLAWAAVGIALVSLGLTARAGALFTLPVLAIWAGHCFADGRRFAWRPFAVAIAAAATGFVATKLATAAVGAPGQIAFGNFAHTLYGLAVGGEIWSKVLSDHPHLLALSDGDQSRAVYALAFDHMRQHPFDLIVGVLHRYNDFLFNNRWHAYVPNGGLRIVLTLLSIAGAVACWRHRRDPAATLLLAGLAGTLLSVPFLGDGGPRVYAATQAFAAALIGAGVVGVVRRFAVEAQTGSADWLLPRAAVAAMAAAILPMALALLPHAPRAPLAESPASACPADAMAVRAFGLRDAAVTICPPTGACRDGVRAASARAADIWKSPHVASLLALGETVHIAGIVVWPQYQSTWMIRRGSTPLPQGAFAGCVKPTGDFLELIGL